MSLKLEIVDDPARAASAMLLSAMLGGRDVVLTGGSTPKPAYEELARAIRAVGHDLRDTTVWFSDDRCVPPDHEDSNHRMVEAALLSRLPIARERVLDTNGAGDTHTGALLAEVAAGTPWVEGCRRANAAAAIKVTRRGPESAPTAAEVDAFLASRDG